MRSRLDCASLVYSKNSMISSRSLPLPNPWLLLFLVYFGFYDSSSSLFSISDVFKIKLTPYV